MNSFKERERILEEQHQVRMALMRNTLKWQKFALVCACLTLLAMIAIIIIRMQP